MNTKEKMKGLECNIFQLWYYEIHSWLFNHIDRLYPDRLVEDCHVCKKCGKYRLKRFGTYSVEDIEANYIHLCRCNKKYERVYQDQLKFLKEWVWDEEEEE